MSKYKTPGVYVEEISVFPPSVAQVETAIPAFVGYTQKAELDGEDFFEDPTNVSIKPLKISSLPEFEFIFGAAPDPLPINGVLNDDNSVRSVSVSNRFMLYDSLRMFYANGGGECYVVAVGNYEATIGLAALQDGLEALEKFDEPTLLVIPESVHLSDSQSGTLHQAMLAQCDKLGDRFAVMDLRNGDEEIGPSPTNPPAVFRNNVGMNNLKYGGCYYPWLNTTLPFNINYDVITSGTYTRSSGAGIPDITTLFNSEIVQNIADIDTDIALQSGLTEPSNDGEVSDRAELETYSGDIADYAHAFFTNQGNAFVDADTTNLNSAASIHARYIADSGPLHGLLITFYDLIHFSASAESDAPSPDWDSALSVRASGDFAGMTFAPPANTANNIFTATDTALNATPYFEAVASKMIKLVEDFYNELKASRTNVITTLEQVDEVYSNIVTALEAKGVVLPPSGAMVGIYAAVDNARGVWKAPANVSVNQVKGPSVNVTHEEQEGLNVDTVAGKSINAIRAFTGKGTMVWGARTLAGNDNEWRYVPVRRFFNMVEESVKKATEQFVFEPNDANTWIKIRAMIENFLTLQWRDGALQGAKAEQAFFVRVGLGETMTSVDILEGRMNVEIGMAVVRPAEFIILKFSHKMAEA